MSEPTVCIGSFCIPVYVLIPIAFIIAQKLWEWIRGNAFSELPVPENSRVVHVTSVIEYHEQMDKAKETKRSLVVDFTASWCGPCRFISPVYHDLSIKYPCTIFLKVDVDEMKGIAASAGVTAMPTFQFFRNGKKCDEMRGADRKKLEELVQKYYVEVELPDDEKPKQATSPAAAEADESKSEGLRQRKALVTVVKSEEEWESLLSQNRESDRTLFVAFGATWNKPSVEMAPIFEALSAKFPTATFASVDVDELGSVVDELEISSPPTYKVFKRGEAVDELTAGIRSALESLVTKHL